MDVNITFSQEIETGMSVRSREPGMLFTFQALHCPFPPPSLLVSFLTSSFTFSRSLGSVGFPFDDGIVLDLWLLESTRVGLRIWENLGI